MRANSRIAILFTILLGVATYALLDSHGEWLLTGISPPASTGAGSAAGPQNAVAREGAGQFALRERAPLGETQVTLFASRAWQPPPQISSAPTVPPMPYRFAGKLLQDGKLQVFLSRGDATIPVKEGETLEGKYRIDSIGEDRITLVYLPLKHKETIPVFSLIPNGGAQAQPAPVAMPAKVAPRVVQENAAPVPAPASNGPPRAPIPTASVISGR